MDLGEDLQGGRAEDELGLWSLKFTNKSALPIRRALQVVTSI